MGIIKITLCVIFLILINITDIKEYKIKNKIILPMIIVGLVFGIIQNSILDNIYGMLIPLVLFPLYVLRMLGAGDIKALCAIGALVGLEMSIRTGICTFLCGGIIAVLFVVFNKNFVERIKYLFSYMKLCFMTKKIHKYDFGGGEKSYFRFAYAISAGVIVAVISSFV